MHQRGARGDGKRVFADDGKGDVAHHAEVDQVNQTRRLIVALA